jgi:predicted RecB family nuclease
MVHSVDCFQGQAWYGLNEDSGEDLMSQSREINLSKSKFIAGLQCMKRLYLQVYQPELRAEMDETTEAILMQGQEVGLLAQKAFPSGRLVDAGHLEAERALAMTQKLMADRSIPAIFEAAFFHEGVLVRIDVLQRMPRNRWRLIEVKSATGVKDYHLYDLAIQRQVLEGCGVKVSLACLMHLNRDYVFDGQEYDLDKLFIQKDLTHEIDRFSEDLPGLLAMQWEALGKDNPPEIEPGAQCTDPFTCEFFDYCNQPLPLGHVACLPVLGRKKLGALLGMGIYDISRIPPDFPLSERQRQACECVLSGTTWISNQLQKELDGLIYPLYFMDFETCYPALPRHAGMRPYDHIPFQWSVHILKRPGGRLENQQFLAEDEHDPRPAFIKSLSMVLKDKGHIVVYNKSFESGRLNDLARWLPEYQARIESIQGRLWDLLPVIRRNVYHPMFQGSFSIKSVLPALIPEMTYEGMAISDGGQAGLAWQKMVRENLSKCEKKKLRDQLIAYCRQDTLAMVRLLRLVQSI